MIEGQPLPSLLSSSKPERCITVAEQRKFPLSPVGRVSFPSVFKPSAMNDKSDPKYSVTLIFPKGTDLSKLKALAQKTWKESQYYGQERFKNPRSPFRKGEEKEHLEGYEPGSIFVRFSGKSRPHVVDQRKQPISAESGDFYAGCWAHVTLTCFAYNNSGNYGVSFGLVNVQKVRDDDSFQGASSSPDDDFDEVEDEFDDEEEAALADAMGDSSEDDIPF